MNPTDEHSPPLPPRRHAERLTEQRNPRTARIDRVSIGEAVALIQAEDRLCCEAAEAVRGDIVRAIEMVVAAFRVGGRLFYIGAGTSGRLGVLDASEQPPTFGADPEMVQGIIAGGDAALRRSIEGAEDRPDDGVQAIENAGLRKEDVLMGIAAGGRTPYVLGALDRARKIGARTILLTCTPPLEGEAALADCQIHALTGAEAITGSTRMKAGTVTKLILNQISTVAMVGMGKVYENLMIDLKPTNSKLRDRAVRILMEVAGLSRDRAGDQLERAGKDLKVAIVMSLGSCGADEARKTLDKEGGHVASTIRTIANE